MIKLTTPNGEEIEVKPDAIEEMSPNNGLFERHAKTILLIDGQRQAVRETMAEIDALRAKAK